MYAASWINNLKSNILNFQIAYKSAQNKFA